MNRKVMLTGQVDRFECTRPKRPTHSYGLPIFASEKSMMKNRYCGGAGRLMGGWGDADVALVLHALAFGTKA